MVKINAPVEGYSNCSKAITQNYLRKIGDHHQTETLNSKANKSHKTRLRKKNAKIARVRIAHHVFSNLKNLRARARAICASHQFGVSKSLQLLPIVISSLHSTTLTSNQRVVLSNMTMNFIVYLLGVYAWNEPWAISFLLLFSKLNAWGCFCSEGFLKKCFFRSISYHKVLLKLQFLSDLLQFALPFNSFS